MSYLIKRRQESAFCYLVLEMAVYQTMRYGRHSFQTSDGELVSYTAGQAALRNGAAMLIGGVLVGIFPPESGVR
ncbi:hypothetical protein E5K00_17535 [Hymenobacter aquaticus]|uniref:Uncharacterized protein n=1 Tax=Hymenobacter aquaticus TaxID=1867101 RepID=A0A4Z0PXN2_9BACT|nr:hypothetical protein [Hymenobacter aquaticus]TGE22054.1 hypothetical protein E5K00_17535 [Hymenobacter aquaticus]